MLSPTLRVGKVREPSLEPFLSEVLAELSEQEAWEMARRMGFDNGDRDAIGHAVTKLANLMGYQ
jgi:hypothetical protein